MKNPPCPQLTNPLPQASFKDSPLIIVKKYGDSKVAVIQLKLSFVKKRKPGVNKMLSRVHYVASCSHTYVV